MRIKDCTIYQYYIVECHIIDHFKVKDPKNDRLNYSA